MKEYAKGPRKKWQGDREPAGDRWGSPPPARRSFGRPPGGDRPPRPSFDERPRRQEGGWSGRPSWQDNRSDGPPRRTFRRDEPAAAPAQAPGPAPIGAAALCRGLEEAKRALAEVVASLVEAREGGLEVDTVEAQVSFAGDGRFLGFGRGGAATLTLSLAALEAEDLLPDPDAEADDEVEAGDVVASSEEPAELSAEAAAPTSRRATQRGAKVAKDAGDADAAKAAEAAAEAPVEVSEEAAPKPAGKRAKAAAKPATRPAPRARSKKGAAAATPAAGGEQAAD